MNEDIEPFSESHLDSPEYREHLLKKLNKLIAVLEVANAKVHLSLAGPSPDLEKLRRIQKNLHDTLQVCLRARTALEGRGHLSAGLSAELGHINPELAQSARVLHERSKSQSASAGRPPRGVGVEMSSTDELHRFKKLGRIRPEMVRTCDLNELVKRLLV